MKSALNERGEKMKAQDQNVIIRLFASNPVDTPKDNMMAWISVIAQYISTKLTYRM